MSKKVLVVDDSATVRQQVRLALQQAGFQVVEAVDGLDGLQKVKAGPEIAMVIADVNMPRMSGLDMLDQIMSTPAGKRIPVMMLTTEGQPELMKRAKTAGAKGWIVKPFQAHLLVAAVQKLAA